MASDGEVAIVVPSKDITEDDDADDTKNPYLALRAAKIARNQARLRSLGLIREENILRPKATTTPAKSRKRPLTTKLLTPRRRSSRIKGDTTSLLPMNDNLGEEESSVPVVRRRRRSSAPKTAVTKSKSSKVNNPDSVRWITLDIPRLLFDNRDGLLGRLLSNTGKQHVVYESYRRGTVAADESRRLSFNKSSGVQ